MEESGIRAEDRRQRQMMGRREKAQMMEDACQEYWTGRDLGRGGGSDRRKI